MVTMSRRCYSFTRENVLTALGSSDEALSLALRAQTGPRTLQLFRALTRLGDAAVLVPLSVVVALPLWWRGRAALALAWLLALGGNALLIALLKRVFERARPLHDHGLVSEPGFSFPSGHSSGTVVAFGMLAYLGLRLLPPRWHLAVLLVAMLLALGVGLSRIILRVHYASDVAAGFASGTTWLAVCITGIELGRWLRHRGRRS